MAARSVTAVWAPIGDASTQWTGKFESLNRLALRFNKTAAGRALIAAYQASRVINDLSGGGSSDTPSAT